VKQRPDIRPGYTVRVHERILEGQEEGKERIQVFEGLVVSVHKGATPTDSTFTVERVFLLHSPLIEKIDVKKVAAVRRAKLFFLRGRHGKAARLGERFTTAEEFAIATAAEEKKETEVVEVVEAKEEGKAEEKKEAQ